MALAKRDDTFRTYNQCVGILELEIGAEQDESLVVIRDGEEVRIGRHQDCTWSLQDDHVSKHHMRIYSVIFDREKQSDYPALVYCEDLESTNGTYVNGRAIGILGSERTPRLLCHGDLIELRPNWRFRFYQEHDANVSHDKLQKEHLKSFASRFRVSDRILGSSLFKVFLGEEIGTRKQLACKIVDVMAVDVHTPTAKYPISSLKLAGAIDHKCQKWNTAFKEIKILSKLNHPNFINLRKAFVSDTSMYIFTDLAAGGDLYSYLDSHGGQLDDLNARLVSRQIVLAIHYIHSKAIAHRDIKPENILVTRIDEGCRVVLTDFGHASVVGHGGRMLTKAGTSGYLAPEVDTVETSNIGYTMAVDMWSLGITTMRILTGDTLIPRGMMTQLSQVQIAARMLHVDDSQLARQWLPVKPKAYKFLGELLINEPERRLNATEALSHAWFKEPVGEAIVVEQAYDRVINFWKPREGIEDVIESLPGRKIQLEPKSAVQRYHRKIPDMTISPHFSLDRHINPRLPSHRKDVLARIEESGSEFLASEGHQPPKASQANALFELPILPKSRVLAEDLKEVNSQDLFGTLVNRQAPRSRQLGPGLEEVLVARSERPTQRVLSCSEDGIAASDYVPMLPRKRASDQKAPFDKRMRKDTEL